MNPLALVPLVASGINALTGSASASAARDAYKTRYQDTVNDMKKAGLNPGLAYSQGAGGQPSTVPLPQLGDTLTHGVSAAMSAAQAKANTRLTEAQTALLNAQTDALSARPGLENLKLQAETRNIGASTAKTGVDTELARANIPLTEARTKGEALRNGLMALDGVMRELDISYASRSLDDRVRLLRKQAEKMGLEVTGQELLNAATRSTNVRREIEATGLRSAVDLVGSAAEGTRENYDKAKEKVQNKLNALHRWFIRNGLTAKGLAKGLGFDGD